MSVAVAPVVDPWRIELLVVRRSHTGAERRSISRDVERRLLIRLRQGVYVELAAFETLAPEDQHIVRMRAHAAGSDAPVVFSHHSAAVLLGLPVLRSRLATLHVTVEDEDDRHRPGLTTHHFLLEGEPFLKGGLVATDLGRTVVDVAGAGPFEEGVMAADAVLRGGAPREVLEAAVELAGPRRAARRIGETVAFAHPGAESAAESRARVTAMRLGVEVPVLQHRILLANGRSAHLDQYFPTARAGVEVDGDVKYLDPRMAPEGAGQAVLDEKRREDDVRQQVAALARIGWVQSGSIALLRPVLQRIGVRATRPRTTIADYARAARRASPRRPIR